MRASLILVAVLSAVSCVAVAQTPTQPPAPATAPVTPATPGASVSGVTVSPLPQKACAPKDRECIAIVVAELKELYPEQLKKFCYQQKMDVMQRDMQANMAGWCDSPTQGASAICNHYVPPIVKQACASDPPTAKK